MNCFSPKPDSLPSKETAVLKRKYTENVIYFLVQYKLLMLLLWLLQAEVTSLLEGVCNEIGEFSQMVIDSA